MQTFAFQLYNAFVAVALMEKCKMNGIPGPFFLFRRTICEQQLASEFAYN